MQPRLSKRNSFWIILIVLSFTITFFITELCVRIYNPNGWVDIKYLFGIKPESNYITDETLHYRPRDRFYFWDNKENPPLEQKDEGVIRIFALGDSFTKPHKIAIERSFYRQVEQRIQKENPFHSVEFFHFGVSGYSEIQFLEILRRYGPKYFPDLAIFQVYLGNDIGENSGLINRQLGFKKAKKTGIIDANKSSVLRNSSLSLKQKLWRTISPANWSALYRLFAIRLRILKYRLLKNKSSPVLLDNINTDNHIIDLFKRNTPSELEQAWDITEQLIVETTKELQAQNIKALFVLVPQELQVNEFAWKEATAILGLNPEDYDIDLPSRRFKELLDKNKLKYLDLTPVFRKSISSGADLYDGHFNQAGHDKTAELIYNSLKKIVLN